MVRGGFFYIITNQNNRVLYAGVTSDLITRIAQHRNKDFPKSFSARYNVFKLVYFEVFESIEEAIDREKQVKSGSRAKKEALIRKINPGWFDLYPEILKWN